VVPYGVDDEGYADRHQAFNRTTLKMLTTSDFFRTGNVELFPRASDRDPLRSRFRFVAVRHSSLR
jgi:hypothetical protein